MLQFLIQPTLKLIAYYVEKKYLTEDKVADLVKKNKDKSTALLLVQSIDDVITHSHTLAQSTTNKFDDKMIKPFVKLQSKVKKFLNITTEAKKK